MAYHTSIYLFVFLPVVLLVYQLTPKKLRWMTLLLSGYVFFWTISGKLVLYLIGTTLFTHYIGVWMSWMKLQCETAVSGLTKEESSIVKKRYKQKEKWILIGGILGLLLALAYLKFLCKEYKCNNRSLGRLVCITDKRASPSYWYLFLYASGNRLYGGCILGKIESRAASRKACSFSGLFSTDHGRSDQHVFANGRRALARGTDNRRESLKGQRAHSLGTIQENDHCGPTLCICAGNL